MPPRRTTLKKSLRAIERAFADIERSLAHLTKRARNAARDAAKPISRKITGRRSLRITPRRRAQLKLQGAYMGFMRQLKPAQKKRVKAVKEKRGFEAAIGVAKTLTRQ